VHRELIEGEWADNPRSYCIEEEYKVAERQVHDCISESSGRSGAVELQCAVGRAEQPRLIVQDQLCGHALHE